MIEGLDLDQGERLSELLCDALIRLARVGDPAWMIMGEDGRRRVMAHGGLEHLARMHARPVDGAPEQFFERDHPMTVIEPEHGEDFVLQSGKPKL